MKKIKVIVLIAMVVTTCIIRAQNTAGKLDDIGRIEITSYVPEQTESLPPIARNFLESKLSQIVSQQGMGGSPLYPRFIISAKVDVLTKDITATAPPMIALTLSITLFIGDGIEGKSFSSYTISAKGVDVSETKAYMSAIKNITVADPAFQTFLTKGKTKIIEYYNTQCDFIIKKAKTLQSQHKYDEAIYELTIVPDACKDCYDKCSDAISPIFKEKINFDCKTKLMDATNVWNSGQSYSSADEAGQILSSIDPESSCYENAKALSSKIAARILEVDKRQWNFKFEREIGLEKDRIKAYRDVGVAWGNGQPKNVTYKSLW